MKFLAPRASIVLLIARSWFAIPKLLRRYKINRGGRLSIHPVVLSDQTDVIRPACRNIEFGSLPKIDVVASLDQN